MAYSSSAVKLHATNALHVVAVRTLRTLAHYTDQRLAIETNIS